MMKKYFNLLVTLLAIVGFLYAIYEKEEIIANGDIVYIALAPVDPRSLMQGDYMRLGYAIEQRKIVDSDIAKTSYLKLSLDEKRVAHLQSDVVTNKIKTNGDILFKYHAIGNRADIEPSSFLFQQGLRKLYSKARYGIFKIDQDQHLLVGLADENLVEIKPTQ